MTESVKRTNCVGITCVESNRCRARLIYLICIRALKTRTKTSRYVMGKVIACHNVYERSEETPFVDRAVYPPIFLYIAIFPVFGHWFVLTFKIRTGPFE